VRRDERGVVAVEFALMLPLILVFLFLIIDFGRVFNYLNDANQIAANGARLAAVNNYPGGAALASQGDTVELRDGGSQVPSKLKVCVRFPDPASPNNDALSNASPKAGDPVKVKATATFKLAPAFGFLGGGLPTIPIHGEATMRLERTPSFAADC